MVYGVQQEGWGGRILRIGRAIVLCNREGFAGERGQYKDD